MNIDTNNALTQNNSHAFTTQRLILFLSKFSLWAVIFLVGFSAKSYPEEKLKVATCQFPVSGEIESNANYIKRFIKVFFIKTTVTDDF